MQNENYAKNKGISQSAIKAFKFKSPRDWKDIYIDKQLDPEKNEEGFTLGSLTDTLLFTPEELDKRFYIGEEEKLPSEAIVWIIKDYYNKIVANNKQMELLSAELPNDGLMREFNLNDVDHLLDSANNYVSKDKEGKEKVGWNVKWSSDARIKNILEQGSSYFDSLKKAEGRKVVSQRMNFDAIDMRDILHKHESVRDYFVPNENNHLIFQLEIFTTYLLPDGNEIPIKGALDIVRFNHIRKTVQIIDFKTSYSAFDFLQNIKKYGYADQLSFYDYLLRQWLVEYCQGKYCEYEMLPPLNIVMDVKSKIPYIYEYEWRDISLAADGNEKFLFNLYQTNDHGQRIKRGWKSLLDEIGWHMVNNFWDCPKELKEKGKITVNLLTS